MQRQFAQKVEDLRRLIENQRSASFLLAVSGGIDSMCMLDMFSKVLPADAFAVAHCNFCLRGEESDGDQALVQSYAAELGVRVFVRSFDTEAYAREKGISIEMAARDLRYEWFAELCAEHGFHVLAVAHNANDNAETLMLNLLRGTGLNGLHGMTSARIPIPSGDNVILFRPLLEATRKQIEGHVLANRVPYRHDSSNFESDYKRNKIRNEVFPVFERINPSFVRTLNREIGYFAEAGSIVDEWCRERLPSVISGGGAFSVVSGELSESGELVIRTDALLSTPHWRYLLYYILSPYGFNHQLLASIESLLASSRTKSGKRFESDTHVLLVERGSLVLKLAADAPISLQPSDGDIRPVLSDNDVMVVRGEGVYGFNGSRFCVEVFDMKPDFSLKQPSGTLVFDAEMMRFPFVCRRWRQGDWLVPFGMRGKKKVSDLFADLKYSADAKVSAVMLVDTLTPDLAQQQHVAALLGVRIDNRYKITSSTQRILLIRVL